MVLTGWVKPVLPGSQFCPAFTPVFTGWSKLVLPMGKTWAKPVFLIGYREEVLRGNKAFLTGWRLTAQLLSNRFRYVPVSRQYRQRENTVYRALISELQHSQCISFQWYSQCMHIYQRYVAAFEYVCAGLFAWFFYLDKFGPNRWMGSCGPGSLLALSLRRVCYVIAPWTHRPITYRSRPDQR